MPDPPITALVSARVTVREGDSVTFYTRAHHAEVGVPLSFDVKEPRLTAVEQFVAAISADVLGGFARLAKRELAYATELMQRVLAGFEGKFRTGLHVCRGNWSKREDVLISGDYQPLVPAFAAMPVDQLVLEFATPRAGELAVVGRALGNREIGLGCVNPRTDEAETPGSIVARAGEAMQFWRPGQIFLNPDCGFACFANRGVNVEEIATAKLRSMVAAAKQLRDRAL